MHHADLCGALKAWSLVLAAPYVTSDAAALAAAGTATFATRSSVLAILRPGTREEVQDCLRIASQYGVAIYPVGSGKNWGYGSSAPPRDAVLLHLGRLNRIVDFSEELAYVTIEPGVTQRQLYTFLQEKGGRLWMDATGSSPDCSIIGNTLERGFGHTPMGDHFANSCNYEVVLPNGDCIETGFGRFADAKTGPVSGWGVGAALQGMFAQSNFGVVTRMTVWLMPAPPRFEAFFFRCDDETAIGPVVDALRPLRLNGTLRSVMHLVNDYKVISATSVYPWEATGGQTPLSPEILKDLRTKMGFGAWNGSGALYGSRAQVSDARRQIKRELKGLVNRLHFLDDRLLRLARRFARPFQMITGLEVSETMRIIDPVFNLMKGVPTDATLASAYWRKRTPVPQQRDPDRDGCGLLWCSPVLPNTSAAVREVTALATRVLLEDGFEPQISLSMETARSAICVTTISYDRSLAGEDERALKSYRSLVAQLLERGYPPYRVNIESMDCLMGSPAFDAVLGGLRRAVDPQGILAPGRYQAEASETSADQRGA